MTDSKRFARKGRVPRLTDTGRARRAADEATLLTIQLAENTKRTDITALELANSYARLTALSKLLGKTQKQLAEKVGITRRAFPNTSPSPRRRRKFSKSPPTTAGKTSISSTPSRKPMTRNRRPPAPFLTNWRAKQVKIPLRPLVDKLLDKAPTTATARDPLRRHRPAPHL